jgi:hypothetical protein
MTFHSVALTWSAAAAAIVVLAGCGSYVGTQSGAAQNAARPDRTPLASRPVAATVAADQRTARNSVLRLSDLPSGWVPAGQPSMTVQNQCPTLIGAKTAATGRANPGYFVSNAARAEVQGAVNVYRSKSEATRWFALVSGQGTVSCVGRKLHDGLMTAAQSQGFSVGPVRTHQLAVEPVGAERAATRITVRVSERGVSADAVLDLVLVRADRGIAVTLFGGSVTPFNSQLEARLLGAVVGRMSAGLAGSAAAG